MSTKRKAPENMPTFGPRFGPGPMTGATVQIKDRRGTLLRLWGYLRRHTLTLVVIVLLVIVTTSLSLVTPYMMKCAIDQYIATGNLRGLALLLGGMLGIYLISSAATWGQSIVMIRIAQRTVRDIRHEMFEKLQALPLRYFDRHPHGELMSRLTNDADTISATMSESVTQLISSVLSVLGAGTIMFLMNWRLALVSLVTFPLVMVAIRWIGGRTRQGFRERQQKIGVLNGIVEETIQGQRVVKVCRHEQQSIAQFTEANTALRKAATNAMIFVGLMGPVVSLFRNFGFAVLVGVGGWFAVKGLITLGTVVAFTNYSNYFSWPLLQLASLYGTVQSALAGAERIFAVMDEAPEVEDLPDAVDASDIKGDVEFAQVDFRYVDDVPVLSDVSFHATAGQTIALVGPTGAGKTTIINLFTRFYDIDNGNILIDGRPLRAYRRASLRRALGIVLQDTFLFADTVRENIRYGRLEATDADVEAAARLANADTFINHLPHGYDTVLTDAGNSLSQGQRQLVAIARAMLADPAILVLDEATSSVDTRTEIHIQQAMRRLMENRTSFIIAHRLSTIQQADCILVIDHGQIVEQGTHTALLANKGVYHHLYTSQLSPTTMPAAGA